MKKQKHIFMLIVWAILVLFGTNSWAQNPTYTCRITNAEQVSCNVYEFDVFIQRTGPTVFKLSHFQLGILVNPAMIPAGGIINVSPVPGSSGLVASQQPPIENFGYDAVKKCILVTPVPPANPPITALNATTIPNINPRTN